MVVKYNRTYSQLGGTLETLVSRRESWLSPESKAAASGEWTLSRDERLRVSVAMYICRILTHLRYAWNGSWDYCLQRGVRWLPGMGCGIIAWNGASDYCNWAGHRTLLFPNISYRSLQSLRLDANRTSLHADTGTEELSSSTSGCLHFQYIACMQILAQRSWHPASAVACVWIFSLHADIGTEELASSNSGSL